MGKKIKTQDILPRKKADIRQCDLERIDETIKFIDALDSYDYCRLDILDNYAWHTEGICHFNIDELKPQIREKAVNVLLRQLKEYVKRYKKTPKPITQYGLPEAEEKA